MGNFIKIIDNYAVFCIDRAIVCVDIDKRAMQILEYYKKIPTNDI